MAKQTMGGFLALLRKAHGYTQQQVAEKLNISNRTLSSWETDRTVPDLLLLPSIADLYGVTVDELIRGERILDTAKEEMFSEKAQRAARKNRYGKFKAKLNMLAGCACAAENLILLGYLLYLYSYSIPLWAKVLIWIIGALGAVACTIILFYFKNNIMLSEGLVLNEDIDEENKQFILTLKRKISFYLFIISLPFIFCTLLFYILFAVLNPHDFIIANTGILVKYRTMHIIVIWINAALSTLLILFAIIYTNFRFKKFATEKQIVNRYYNTKLAVKITGIGVIPFAISFVLFFIFSVIDISYHNIVYENSDIAVFRAHMQTLTVEEGDLFSNRGATAGEFVLSFPEQPIIENYQYDLGNGFYGKYSKSQNVWNVTYGINDFYNSQFSILDIRTGDGYTSYVNVKYRDLPYQSADYSANAFKPNKVTTNYAKFDGENYSFICHESIFLDGVFYLISIIVTAASVVTCITIYVLKHKKQIYSF